MKWTEEEINNIKEYYPKYLWGYLLQLFPNRTKKSIKRKAEELKLKRNDEVKFEQNSIATKNKWKEGKFPEKDKNICKLCNTEFLAPHHKNRNFVVKNVFIIIRQVKIILIGEEAYPHINILKNLIIL